MNSTLITTWFLWVLETNWQASLLALLVMLVGRVTRDRLSPQARHALWLLVVARLLLPVLPASPTSLAGFSTTVQTKLLELVSDPFDASSSAESADVTLAPVPDARLRWHADREGMAASAVADQSPTRPPAKIDAPDVESMSSVHSADDVGRKVTLCRSMALIWLAGVLTCLAGGGWCWRRFRRQLQSDFRPADERLMTQLDEARKQLAMRRSVRLAVTSVVGTPAVTGLWRPTILLPPRVAAELTQAQLRLVLLHELAHLRRGDLLLGWLAAGLTAIHWFNPLLRHVFARMRQLRELACDQAVVAAIGHNQARDYGRTIVRVLELLDDFAVHRRAAPLGVTGMAFWFGRDADSIEERIRMLTNDPVLPRRRRTLLAILLAATLAAVGLTDGRELPNSSNSATAPPPVPASRAGSLKQHADDLVTRVYEAKDLHRAIHQRDDRSRREHLSNWLRAAAQPNARGSFKWLDGHLVVRQTEEVHQRLARSLAHLRDQGVDQIAMEITLLTVPGDPLLVLPAEWSVQPMQPERLAHGHQVNDAAASGLPVEAHTTLRKELPVMLHVAEDKQASNLIDSIARLPGAQVLARPKVATLNGQIGSLVTASERPFVVGMQNREPQLRVVQEGIQMQLCPLMLDADTVHLDCNLQMPRVASVVNAEVRSAGGELITLQVPEVETTRLHAAISLPLDKSLLLAGVKAQQVDGQWQSVVVMLRARRLDDQPRDDGTTAAALFSAPADAVRASHQEILPSPRPAPAPKAADAQQSRTGRMLPGLGIDSDSGSTGNLILAEPAEPLPPTAPSPTSPTGMKQVTYNVADLVVPLPHFAKAEVADKQHASTATPPQRADFKPLVDLITSTIAPTTWDTPDGNGWMVQGKGWIVPVEKTLSLAVLQTQEAHDQIADLLKQLRSLQEVQVALEVKLLKLNGEVTFGQESVTFDSLLFKPAGVKKANQWLSEQAEVLSLPKVTLFNQQSADLSTSFSPDSNRDRVTNLHMRPQISSDRRTVQLNLAIGPADERDVPQASHSAEIADGGMLVWDISQQTTKRATDSRKAKRSDSRILLVVIPHIIVVEEDEQLLERKIDWSRVTPPGILQPEEEFLGRDSVDDAVVR